MTSAQSSKLLTARKIRTLSLASLGSALEFYDFVIFVFFTTVIGRLFFSDSLPERRLENIRAMRALQERKLSQLHAIEQKADHMHPGPRLTLELGISITQGIIDWCDAAMRRIGEE